MRILNSTTLHGWSAGSWYAVEMMRGLAERGHDIHMLVPEGRTALAAREAGFSVITEPDLISTPPSAWKATIRRLRELRDDTVRPDVVLAHHGPDHSWWGMLPRKRIGTVPLVRVRTVDPREPSRHPLSRWLHRHRTDAFIVANETQRKAYLKRHRLKPDVVFRIPPGFDLDAWHPERDDSIVRGRCGLDARTLLITSVARFASQKDHATFFAAAGLLSTRVPDVHYLVAGYPAELKATDIEEVASRYPGLEVKYTLWSERLTDGNVIVKSADIGVVHSSGSEAICRVALEYMASRIPVIATKIGTLCEVIHEGRSGILVPPGNPEALAGAIYRLVINERFMKRLGEAGRERLEDVFSFDAAVCSLERALVQTTRRT